MTTQSRVFSGLALVLAAFQAKVGSVDAAFGENIPYKFSANVEEHARISLDVSLISDQLDECISLDSCDAAFATYQFGNHSSKGDTLRTLQGFSTAIQNKTDALSDGESFLPDLYQFVEYFDDLYGDVYVKDMMTSSSTGVSRKQLVLKTIQYQIVWMYVLYEMAAALDKCGKGNLKGAAKNWDEAVAFYTGVEGANAADPFTGTMLWTFANKRCGKFKTCEDNSDVALANTAAFVAFGKGLEQLQAGNCGGASEQRKVVRKYMQLPLLQGILYYGGVKSTNPDATEKDFAEAWAFARGVLPYLDQADEQAAFALKEALYYGGNGFGNGTGAFVSGPIPVFDGVYAALEQLCISCDELGANYLIDTNNMDVPRCTTNETKLQSGCSESLRGYPVEEGNEKDEVDIGLIVGLVIGAVVIIGILVAIMLYMKKMEAQDAAKRSTANKTADAQIESGQGQGAEHAANSGDDPSSLQQV